MRYLFGAALATAVALGIGQYVGPMFDNIGHVMENVTGRAIANMNRR